MRPLTAYHIFFQIEREYIIQTTAGEDADKSIHDNKVYLDDTPQRYMNIKLRPDWYAGPGKRQKRKHRKQHGKIGFLELSRVISTRWAQLEQIDQETKSFVQRIAKQELDEYYREMKEHKELTKDLVPDETAKSMTRPSAPKKKTKKRSSSTSSMQLLHPRIDFSLPMQQQQPLREAPQPAMVRSLYQSVDRFPPISDKLKNDIDHFLNCIDNKTQHLLPPPFRGEINQASKKRKTFHRQDSLLSVSRFDHLMEVPNYVNTPIKYNQHSMGSNNASSRMSPTSVEVDICDDEILQLWKSHHV